MIRFFKKESAKKFFTLEAQYLIDKSTKSKFPLEKIIATLSLDKEELFNLLSIYGVVKKYKIKEKMFLKKFVRILEIDQIPCENIRKLCK